MKKNRLRRGTGIPLQFIHANAYTPECYHTLLDPLKEHYHVHLYRQRPLWPNKSPTQLKNWNLFATDLISMMDEHGAWNNETDNAIALLR